VPGQVFVSYAREDQAYVGKLVDYLQSYGVDVWTDRLLPPGTMTAQFERTLQREIEECVAFIVVMTPESRDSDWVGSEVEFAAKVKKPVFPLLLSGQPFLRFSQVQYADVQGERMPPATLVEALLDHQVAGSEGGPERSAMRMLAEDGGPLRAYLKAEELIRSAPKQLSHLSPQLQPIPAEGTNLGRLTALRQLMPAAADQLERMADDASRAAKRHRSAARDKVKQLSVAGPRPSALVDGPPTRHRKHRRSLFSHLATAFWIAVGVGFVLIIVGYVVAAIAGVSDSKGFIWWVGGINIACFGGFPIAAVMLWYRDGFAEKKHVYAQRLSAYHQAAAQRVSAQAAYDRSETARQARLAAALSDEAETDRVAADLELFVRRSRAIAESLSDPSTLDDVDGILRRSRPKS
jgi:hypothetical protein